MKPVTHQNRIRKNFAFLFLGVFTFFACSENGEDDVQPGPLSISIPAEMWVDNARSFLQAYDTLTLSKQLVSEIPGTNAIARLFFDEENSVRLVRIKDSLDQEQSYYFDDGRIAYSIIDFNDGSGIQRATSAYAKNSPYAHVLGNGSVPTSEQVQIFSPAFNLIQKMVPVALAYEKKEKAPAYQKRITENQVRISESLNGKKEFLIVKNVTKGERLNVQLNSPEDHIYFTVYPNNGSDMEHRFWRGNALITGDIHIRVFAADELKNDSFSLTLESS